MPKNRKCSAEFFPLGMISAMDRRTLISSGALIAIFALLFSGRSQPESPSELSQASFAAEPARLDLIDADIKPVPSARGDDVLPAAFPFFSRGESQSPVRTEDLVAPDVLTPSLALPKNSAIALPSANATPAPIEHLPVVDSTQAAMPTASATVGPATAPERPRRPSVLAAAITRSEQLTREGLVLAEKGAIFSARSRYWQALRQIVIAQDEVNATKRHSVALRAAQKAIEESHDFDEALSANYEPLDVARIVSRHRTELLQLEDLAEVSPAAARDRYQYFAVEQLTAAMGGELLASMPLFGLGKTSAASGKANSAGDIFGSSDALVWYHAALMTDAANFRAAHELGSLYAQRGEWDRARVVLQRAVAIHPHPVTWGNLAIVHGTLGEKDWALAAQSQANSGAAQITNRINLPPIQWVDESTFANSTGPNEAFFPQQAKPPVVTRPPADAEPRSAAKPKSAIPWFPWGSTHRR
jgi:tetratricopeptide (TPR) repeat protein